MESFVNIVLRNKYKRLPIDSRGETEIILSVMKRDGVRKMRGKAKQRVSLILVVTMVLGTVLTGNTVFATGESSDEQDRIKINISKDSEQRGCEKRIVPPKRKTKSL